MVGECVMLGMLAVASREDLKTKTLPMLFLLLTGIAGAVIFLWERPFSAGELLGGIMVGGFLLLCSLISRESIGRGDGVLFCITGIFLGFRENVLLLATALLLTSAGALACMALRRCGRRFRIPFAPFVLAAHVLLLCR